MGLQWVGDTVQPDAEIFASGFVFIDNWGSAYVEDELLFSLGLEPEEWFPALFGMGGTGTTVIPEIDVIEGSLTSAMSAQRMLRAH